MADAIAIPLTVRNKALLFGASQWLAQLPDLIAGLEHDWSITVGPAFPDATEAFVARATPRTDDREGDRHGDRAHAVLKLCVPRPDADELHEITVLRLVDGQGCAKLLRADPARGALLIERLGPSMHDLGLPIGQRHELLCAAVEQVWRPAREAGLPTGAGKGRWLIDDITAAWETLDQPCHERTIEHAISCATSRIAAHDEERAVLVHGDVHEWNALAAPGGGFKLVDPDGLLAEAEYDLGVMMREDPVELMAGDPMDRARWLAARCGLDPKAIWEWGVVERVSTGLLGTQIGMQPVASQMLAAADEIAGASHAR